MIDQTAARLNGNQAARLDRWETAALRLARLARTATSVMDLEPA